MEAFEKSLSNQVEWRLSPLGLEFSRIDDSEASILEALFSEEEVRAALLDLNGYEASGPDGFTKVFWQENWDVVKVEIMNLFREFHDKGRFVKSLNSTFIVLILKKGEVEELKDFRPISVIGSIYKWIAKVLANRLKRVVGKVVNAAQNAFVEGRQILDASLLANEIVDSLLRKREKGILCKLDIEQAYDSVNWNFLIQTMQKMGFGEKWLGLI